MAYYPDGAVEVTGETRAYVWGDRMIGIHHCPVCGCLTHWRTLGDRGHQEQPPAVPSDAHVSKMGMNARLLDEFDPAAVEVRAVDGASW
ncbi:hypothetical protein SAMN06295912_11865 [Sphingomonas laterariae]|uniref:Glutathione-dependent formaldehyde-activating enzyme n=2 Tax=Edaphosphingomonas laterariae TaxID=861865 RepID=A0A239HQP5_9SPHN|nr:hypothetical protein SAMN06295912_11865 [Sphingomonas laterariae]